MGQVRVRHESTYVDNRKSITIHAVNGKLDEFKYLTWYIEKKKTIHTKNTETHEDLLVWLKPYEFLTMIRRVNPASYMEFSRKPDQAATTTIITTIYQNTCPNTYFLELCYN